MPSSRLKNWNTMPMCRRRMIASSSSLLPTSGSPASDTSPSVGVSSPATMLSSVDFPQPDGPITATNSPGVIVKSTPRSARTGAPSDSKVLRSPLRLDDPLGSSRSSRTSFPVPCRRTRRCGTPAPASSVPSPSSRRAPRTRRVRRSAACVALVHHDASRRARQVLEPLREVHRVAHQRVLDAFLGAEERGGDRRRSTPRCPSPNGALARGQPPLVQRTLALEHRARPRAPRGRRDRRAAPARRSTPSPRRRRTA